jgi:hypothetical protein
MRGREMLYIRLEQVSHYQGEWLYYLVQDLVAIVAVVAVVAVGATVTLHPY